MPGYRVGRGCTAAGQGAVRVGKGWYGVWVVWGSGTGSMGGPGYGFLLAPRFGLVP